jgi:hypothetical protein
MEPNALAGREGRYFSETKHASSFPGHCHHDKHHHGKRHHDHYHDRHSNSARR